MKSLLKKFLFNLFSLWLLSSYLPLLPANDFTTLAPASLTLTLLDIFIKPVINLLLLPLNLLTFGLLSWVSSVAILYLTGLIYPGFSLIPLSLPASQIFILHFPPVHFGFFTTLLLLSLLLVILKKILSNLLS